MFNFSIYRPSSFKHLSHRTVQKHQLRQSWHRSSQHADQVVPHQQCLLCHEQTSYTKRVLLVS